MSKPFRWQFYQLLPTIKCSLSFPSLRHDTILCVLDKLFLVRQRSTAKRTKLSPSLMDSWADAEKTASEFAKEEEWEHFKV